MGKGSFSSVRPTIREGAHSAKMFSPVIDHVGWFLGRGPHTLGCCQGMEFFHHSFSSASFFFCFGPWDWKTQWGGPGQRAQCCRLCPSHWQQEACGWPPRALIYDTALQRPGGVSVSDGDPGLLQNGTRRGVFTVPTLLRQRGKFHCLTGQFTAMGLSPCFSSLCFFCLLIKCEVTKQLNSSVVFRQEVEKGYPGGKANMIDRGWLEIYIGNNSFLKTFFISWWEVWGKSSTRRMDD